MTRAIRFVRVGAMVLVGLTSAGCAVGPSSNAGRGDLGPDGGGDNDSGAGLEGGVAQGDSVPQGAISFFNASACPRDWSPFSPASGRSIVPTIAGSATGTTFGTPLADGEDRVHHHGYSGSVTFGDTSYVGAVGGGNPLAPSGAVMYSGTTEPASSNLPYVQLLVCQKDAMAVAGSRPIARGTMFFFGSSGCPDGWAQAAATQGRFLVGLPDGAKPDLSFGGNAVKSEEQRSHVHPYSGSVTPTSHGIALLNGCCGGGYAKADSVMIDGTTSDSAAALPYLQLLQCQKQ